MAIDRTLIQIRERGFFDLLELAMVVVRSRPRSLGLAALAGVLPWAVLNAAILPEGADAIGPWILLLAFEAPWATAPLTVVLGGIMFGDRPSASRVAITLLRSLPAMIVYQGLLRAVLLGFLFTAPLVPAKLAFLNEVILLERGRFRSTAGRSWRLCGDRGGDLFFQWLAFVGFGLGFVVAFRWAAEEAVKQLFGSGAPDANFTFGSETLLESLGHWAFDLHGWSAHLAIWLVVSFGGVVRFLTYIDRRIRLEGWEVELRLRMVGSAMEDPERW